ncbi:MAG: hypothetical protein Q4G58_10290 [bacterium]|nr:hypothetical protein [bacterium]
MKRRYLVSTLLIAIILVILLVIAFRSKEMDDFVDYTVIDKITITDGATGELMTIKDEGTIAKFKEYLDNLTFRRKIGLSKGDYLYRMDFYYGKNVEIRITIRNDRVQIDNETYTMTNHNGSSWADFLESLKK